MKNWQKDAEQDFIFFATIYVSALIDHELNRMNLLKVTGRINEILIKER